jgi:DNA invertase Pin-like site-specific DNA recombinase
VKKFDEPMFCIIAGLQAARKRGRIGGSPRVDKKIVERALKLYESKEYSVAEITELTGVSKATLYRRLKVVNS